MTAIGTAQTDISSPAEEERQRADAAESLLERERQRAETLAQRLRDLGID